MNMGPGCEAAYPGRRTIMQLGTTTATFSDVFAWDVFDAKTFQAGQRSRDSRQGVRS